MLKVHNPQSTRSITIK